MEKYNKIQNTEKYKECKDYKNSIKLQISILFLIFFRLVIEKYRKKQKNKKIQKEIKLCFKNLYRNLVFIISKHDLSIYWAFWGKVKFHVKCAWLICLLHLILI